MSSSTSSSFLSDKLDEIRQKTGVCALSVLVLRNGSVVDVAASGSRRKSRPAQATADDVWHIASCGKAMTATMIARLVEKSALSWNSKLSDSFRGVHSQLADATILQLLSHSSGVCRDFSDFHLLRRRRGQQMKRHRDALAAQLVTRKPKHPCGTTFLYSNAGYIVAAVMAERATGKSYEELMREEVFEPLGMTTAAFGALDKAAAREQPWGHIRLPGGFHCPVCPRAYEANSQLFAPASTIFLSMRDWAKFAQTHMDAGASGLLSQAGFDVLHTPVLDNYACGWVTGKSKRTAPGSTVLEHHGGNPFWASKVALYREANIALLFAVNECGSNHTARVSKALKEVVSKYLSQIA